MPNSITNITLKYNQVYEVDGGANGVNIICNIGDITLKSDTSLSTGYSIPADKSFKLEPNKKVYAVGSSRTIDTIMQISAACDTGTTPPQPYPYVNCTDIDLDNSGYYTNILYCGKEYPVSDVLKPIYTPVNADVKEVIYIPVSLGPTYQIYDNKIRFDYNVYDYPNYTVQAIVVNHDGSTVIKQLAVPAQPLTIVFDASPIVGYKNPTTQLYEDIEYYYGRVLDMSNPDLYRVTPIGVYDNWVKDHISEITYSDSYSSNNAVIMPVGNSKTTPKFTMTGKGRALFAVRMMWDGVYIMSTNDSGNYPQWNINLQKDYVPVNDIQYTVPELYRGHTHVYSGAKTIPETSTYTKLEYIPLNREGYTPVNFNQFGHLEIPRMTSETDFPYADTGVKIKVTNLDGSVFEKDFHNQAGTLILTPYPLSPYESPQAIGSLTTTGGTIKIYPSNATPSGNVNTIKQAFLVSISEDTSSGTSVKVLEPYPANAGNGSASSIDVRSVAKGTSVVSYRNTYLGNSVPVVPWDSTNDIQSTTIIIN